MFAGTLRGENIPPQDILARNVSASGLSAHSKATPPPVGAKVFLSLGAIDNLEATVRWSQGQLFGLEFSVEIDPSLFNFSGRDWSSTNKEYPSGHVYDQFKPVSSTWRPGVKPPKK